MRAVVGLGLWPAQPRALGAGGTSPRKRDTPSPWGRRLLWSDCGCYSASSVEACHGRVKPIGKASGGCGSQDSTHGMGGHAPWQTHPRCHGGTTPRVVLARAPFCHQRMESTGVQLVPDRFSSVLRGKCFLPITVLYLLLPPCGWKLLSHQAPDLEVAAFFPPVAIYQGTKP